MVDRQEEREVKKKNLQFPIGLRKALLIISMLLLPERPVASSLGVGLLL